MHSSRTKKSTQSNKHGDACFSGQNTPSHCPFNPSEACASGGTHDDALKACCAMSVYLFVPLKQ